MLSKYEVCVSKEKIEKVDILRYSWRNLQTLSKQVQGNLVQVQPVFKERLTQNVEQFELDLGDFFQQYEEVSLLRGLTRKKYFCPNNIYR